MGIETFYLRNTPTGVTGSATGSTTSGMLASGRVLSVYFGVGTGGTASVELSMESSADEDNILALGTVTASGWYYPRKQVCDYMGTVVATTGGPVVEPFVVHDKLQMRITEATSSVQYSMLVYVLTS